MSGILIYFVLFVIILLRMRKQGTAKGNGKSTPVSGQQGSPAANRRPRRTPVASDPKTRIFPAGGSGTTTRNLIRPAIFPTKIRRRDILSSTESG